MAHDLERFVTAQESVWPNVVRELKAGRKTSHWMWFVFPQLVQLGRSSTARFYGISGVQEATDFLAHPVLGARLGQCTALVLNAGAASAHDIFGSPDDLKLASCMTLFDHVSGQAGEFGAVLDRFYGGRRDEQTLRLLHDD